MINKFYDCYSITTINFMICLRELEELVSILNPCAWWLDLDGVEGNRAGHFWCWLISTMAELVSRNLVPPLWGELGPQENAANPNSIAEAVGICGVWAHSLLWPAQPWGLRAPSPQMREPGTNSGPGPFAHSLPWPVDLLGASNQVWAWTPDSSHGNSSHWGSGSPDQYCWRF